MGGWGALESLSSLPADGLGSVPALLVWPRGVPAPAPVGCWVGPGAVSVLMRPTRSRHVHVDERVTRDSHPPLQGTLPDQQVGLAQAPIKRLLLPRDFMCAFKSEVSVSLSPVRSCNEAPLAFKAKCSGSSPSRCWTPGLGSLTWGSELSLLWENFCNVITLQCVCRPPGGQGMGFDYFASLLLLPSHCGSFFMLEKVFSGRFQSFSLMVVLQIVVILVCL